MRLAKASEARRAPNTLFSTRGLAKACEPLRRAEKLNCWPVQLISRGGVSVSCAGCCVLCSPRLSLLATSLVSP